jgi:hypothetical protein
MPKLLIVLFCLLALGFSTTIFTNRAYITGSTNTTWISYNNNVAIYQSVDLTSLGLTKVPAISTSLSCTGFCFLVTGTQSHYNLTKNGFSVYIRYVEPAVWGVLTPAIALQNSFVLNYIVYPQE